MANYIPNKGLFISVEKDIKELLAYTDELGAKHQTVVKNVLRAFGAAAVKNSRKEYKKLGIGTGTRDILYKSITHQYLKKERAELVRATARRDDKVLYGYVVAKGAKVKAKNKEYLTFKINDKWVKKKEVLIKGRDYIDGPTRRLLASSEAHNIINKQLEREIKKAEKKAAQAK